MAAPGQSIASVTGCIQTDGAMAMAGCKNPGYLCGFGSSSNLLSQGALSSARSHDLLKAALSLVVGEVPLPSPDHWAILVDKGRLNPSVIGPHKVSIGLSNSVLNL
jgi:hypothetical protein